MIPWPVAMTPLGVTSPRLRGQILGHSPPGMLYRASTIPTPTGLFQPTRLASLHRYQAVTASPCHGAGQAAPLALPWPASLGHQPTDSTQRWAPGGCVTNPTWASSGGTNLGPPSLKAWVSPTGAKGLAPLASAYSRSLSFCQPLEGDKEPLPPGMGAVQRADWGEDTEQHTHLRGLGLEPQPKSATERGSPACG